MTCKIPSMYEGQLKKKPVYTKIAMTRKDGCEIVIDFNEFSKCHFVRGPRGRMDMEIEAQVMVICIATAVQSLWHLQMTARFSAFTEFKCLGLYCLLESIFLRGQLYRTKMNLKRPQLCYKVFSNFAMSPCSKWVSMSFKCLYPVFTWVSCRLWSVTHSFSCFHL